MGLFGPKRPLGKEELEWQLAAFAWFLQEDGGVDRLRASQLVSPESGAFSDTELTGHDRAELRLSEVKRLCQMGEDWPTRLVAQEPQRGFQSLGNAAGTIIPAPEGGAAGTFSIPETTPDEAWVAEITYDPALLADEGALVATLAHEVAHFWLAGAKHSFPGGEPLHEHLTDLAAVYLGFGVFLANNARDYAAQQTELGHMWQYRHAGYLSERALVTALVITEHLAGRDPAAARPWLKPYLQQDLDLAMRWFAKRDVAALVAASDLDAYGVEARDTDVAE
jgi:hypothetical protein